MKLLEILTPAFEKILMDQNAYSFEDVVQAKRLKQIEIDESERLGISVDQLRMNKYMQRKQYNSKINEHQEKIQQLKNADLDQFESAVKHYLIKEIEASGGKFVLDDEKTKLIYKEIVRYFYWNGKCEILDKRKFMYIFGAYGCGKSTLVKCCMKALNHFNHDNWQYFHLPTLINKAIADKSIKPFDVLFTTNKNMVIDEIGDGIEKQKIYGDEIQSIRSFVLDKYDKWISNNQFEHAQKIVFTSNLFPDNTYFFTQSNIERPTIRSFYDEKMYNKIIELCNLVRFPNVSHRKNNKIELI
jgi:hypothetical protein